MQSLHVRRVRRCLTHENQHLQQAWQTHCYLPARFIRRRLPISNFILIQPASPPAQTPNALPALSHVTRPHSPPCCPSPRSGCVVARTHPASEINKSLIRESRALIIANLRVGGAPPHTPGADLFNINLWKSCFHGSVRHNDMSHTHAVSVHTSFRRQLSHPYHLRNPSSRA